MSRQTRARWTLAGCGPALGCALLAAVAGIPAWAQTQGDAAAPPRSDQALTPEPGSDRAPASFSWLVKPLLPAVVNIATTQEMPEQQQMPRRRQMPQLPPGSPFEDFFRDFFGEDGPGQRPLPRRPGMALGSGFVIDAEGYVVTNNHVVEHAESIKVIFSDGTERDARLVGRDPRTDLALLKVEADQPLPSLAWGDSDRAEVGDWVVAIGNPFGLGGTVTAGIISARARNINIGPYDEFLQTDASINRGNSGGPMIDTEGRVIGIATAIFSPSGGSIGIGFAIPSSLARPVIDQLRDHGEVRRGWIGVTIQPVTPDIAEAMDLDRPRGALVADVQKNSPAASAGVKPGDVIIGFADQPVEDVHRLPRLVADSEIGGSASLTVWRDGTEQSLEVTIGDLQQAAATAPAATGSGPAGGNEPSLGLALVPLAPDVRQQFGIDDDVAGVVVEQVAENSPAAEQGIQAGDVIVQVGRTKVDQPADVIEQIDQVRKSGSSTVLLLVNRDGANRFVPMPVEKKAG